MDLKEYLWSRKITQRRAFKELHIALRSICQYVKEITSPSLLSALKIFAYTGTEVRFIEMLSKRDLIKLREYLEGMRLTENNSAVVSDMIDQIKKVYSKKNDKTPNRVEKINDW